MSWAPHTTVAALIERDGRFLMVEESPDGGPTVFNQPAGHLEPGESLTQAVIRETREETGWGFIPHALIGIYRWQVPENGRTYLRFCFQWLPVLLQIITIAERSCSYLICFALSSSS